MNRYFKFLRKLDLLIFNQGLKLSLIKLFNLENVKNIFVCKTKFKILALIILIFPIFYQKQIFTNPNINKYEIEKNNINWENLNIGENNKEEIIWKKVINIKEDNDILKIQEVLKYKDLSKNDNERISSFNRSIVFNDSIVGPDISWLVPPGFRWNNKYKFDASTRGHSGRFEKGRNGKNFWGWNGGDAVGQFYYQFLHNKKNSYGINFGIRSVYAGSYSELGGATNIGEGQSLGFRIDRKISSTEGFSFGAEQLLHFDGLTDTGRDIYLTFSKAL